jgi:hypothetical protein
MPGGPMLLDTVVDLTKVSVDLKLEFDTLDAVLLVTTGGIGYLARQAYKHFSSVEARRLELQQRNFASILAEAQAQGASKLIVRIDPHVNVYAPNGGSLHKAGSGKGYIEWTISIGKPKPTKKLPSHRSKA